ncbi:MAG TPA: molybdopterin cofactor-binding domain-containing protein [Chloroflexota bacterium]|jgi:carbon-monoxide dehydrogenase large subunit|nr:molybdopterin cofactor-binding domain-containing protein [Chloroflexota bacterium]
MAVSQMIGARIQRREDPRLITGGGRYIEDLKPVGALTMALVRSPHPHARIRRINADAARALPGVVAVLVASDFKEVLKGSHPVAPAFVAEKLTVPDRYPIAADEVVFQGEPVVVVLAENRKLAVDAAEAVEVDYEPLPAVTDLFKALEPNSPKAHVNLVDNRAWDLTYAGEDTVSEAFARAEVVVKERVVQQRLAPTAMEPRGVVAEYSEYDGQLTLWLGTQNPHFIRLFVAGMLGMAETKVRVISEDVGGGFGSKISPYPEDYLVAAAARLLKRPVRWIETRSESIQATTHGRGQLFDVEIAAMRDGSLLALKVTQYLDTGAYVGTFGAFQACACLLAGGAYKWPGGVAARTVGVLTNRVPTDPYRGAGRPEATHNIERILDKLAHEIGMDPVAIRQKNFIQPDEFPFTNNFGLIYDSGNYQGAMDQAVQLVEYDAFRKRQAQARAEGRYLGIGISSWIEICGFGPSAATVGATGGLALIESAQVRIHPTGSAQVFVGTHAQGQGHETTFAQIAADTLGLPYESIEIRHGDTAEGAAFGYGTYGSRSLAVGGMAVRKTAKQVVAKAHKIAAHLLEAAPDDVVFDQGRFHVKGNPGTAKTMAEVAFASFGASLPEGVDHGLEATSYFDPPNFVWPFGTHICIVEVDPNTGSVNLEKYVAVDDCGEIINPLIVEGQLHGGIAQGIAQALFEEVSYDEETGQLLTGTLQDYLVPTANEIPTPVLGRTITPSPSNELGVKGIGEAGTIASSVAVINAIVDALQPLGITHIDMPASPDRLWQQIRAAQGAQA